MMDVKARERFSEVLAVVLGAMLIGFLLYLVLSQQVDTPNVPPVNVSSDGPAIAVADRSSGAVKSSPRHVVATTPANPQMATIAVRDPKTSSASINAGQKDGSGAFQPNTSSKSLLSTAAASLTCDTPLRPVATTVSGIEKGLQSVLPLAKTVSVTTSCSS